MTRRRYELTDGEWSITAPLLADKGYDSNAIREAAARQNAWANIPSRSNRIKHFRRIAAR